MKHYLKYIYTGIYILFLLAVFILFAIGQNAPFKNKWFYVTIFMMMVLGSLLFLATIQKTKEVEGETANEAANSGEEQAKSPDEAANEIIQGEESQIDIMKIIPPKSATIDKYAEELLQNMAATFRIVQGLLYIRNPNEEQFHCFAQYAYFSEDPPKDFKVGETLPGQAVKNKIIVSLNNIPDHYMTIASGLGKSDPKLLVFVPLKNHDEVVGLIEYATFEPLTDKHYKALEGIAKKAADTISKHLKK